VDYRLNPRFRPTFIQFVLRVKPKLNYVKYSFLDEDGSAGHRDGTHAKVPYFTIEADTQEEFLEKQNKKVVEVIDSAVGASTHGVVNNIDYHLNFAENLLIGYQGSPKVMLIHPETFKRIFEKIQDKVIYDQETVTFDGKSVIFSSSVAESDIYFLDAKGKLGVVPIKKRYDGKSGTIGVMIKRGLVSKLILQD
jgi:hypothetical protein